MKLSVDMEMGVDIIHRMGKEINVNKRLTKTWEEDSEEFKTLVEAYEEESKTKREESNKNRFDESLLRYAAEQIEQNEKESRENIVRVFHSYCLGEADKGYIEYAGYIFNLADISAIRFNETKLRVRKD